MDKKQMEMLSVKSALERAIQGLIASHQSLRNLASSKDFFADVERLVASFFVSQQIGSDYSVRSVPPLGDLEIRFSTGKHKTCLTMLLPTCLQWKEETSTIPSEPKANDRWYDTHSDKCLIFNGSHWVVASPYEDCTDAPKFEFVSANLVKSEDAGTIIPPSTVAAADWPFPTAEEIEEARDQHLFITRFTEALHKMKDKTINDDERALRAYEKAKKAVERM